MKIFFKDSSSSASDNDFTPLGTSDDDLTPDLDLGTCSNLTKKRVLSIGCENLQHSLTEDIDSDESDVSIYSDTTYVDSF